MDYSRFSRNSQAGIQRTNFNNFKKFNNEIVLPKDYVLVSFNVVSLFTNVPLNLAKQVIEEKSQSLKQVTPILRFIRMALWIKITISHIRSQFISKKKDLLYVTHYPQFYRTQ